MAKKLIVFIWVATCTSAANGTLYLYPHGDTVTFSGNIDHDMYILAGVYDATLSPMSDAALGPAAPSFSEYSGPLSDLEGTGYCPCYMQGGYWVLASAPGESYQTGDYLNLTFSDAGPDVQFFAAWFDESGGYGRMGDILIPEVFLGLRWDFETNIITVCGFTEEDISVVLVGSDVTLSPLSDDALGPAASGSSAYGGPSSELEGLGYFPEGMEGGYWNLKAGQVIGKQLLLNASDVGPTGRVFAAIYGGDMNEYRIIGDIMIPEPMTFALLALGELFILWLRRN